MRGLASVWLSRQPEASSLRSGLLMLACSDRYAGAIADRVLRSFPNTHWTVLKRDEPGIASFSGSTMFSAHAGSLRGQLSILLKVHRQRFDVVVLSCTSEPSYGRLKFMGILTGFKHLCIVDENLQQAFLGRENHGRSLFYLRRGIAAGWYRWQKSLLRTISWLLAPIGFLYVLCRFTFLAARRRLHKRRAVQD